MQPPEPQAEHRWLQRLVGQWSYEHAASVAPDAPPQKFKGTETVRSLGGLWVVCEGQGEMPGGGMAYTIMTLGYDPAKRSFVGTFIGSMMTNLWVYEGDLAGDVLTLQVEGASMSGDGKMALYKDAIELKSDKHRVLTSQVQNPDGTWNQFMTANYYRQ